MAPSLLYFRWYFSVKHSLHILLEGLNVWAQSINFQLNEFLMFLSFSSQMCLLSSVLFCDLAPGLILCLNEDVCLFRREWRGCPGEKQACKSYIYIYIYIYIWVKPGRRLRGQKSGSFFSTSAWSPDTIWIILRLQMVSIQQKRRRHQFKTFVRSVALVELG